MTAMRVMAAPNVPEITTGVDIARMADEAIAALAADEGVYQRSGVLVHVVRETKPFASTDKIRRPLGAAIIRPIAYPTLYERLSTCARWIKWNGRSKSHVPTIPSKHAASAVHARGEWGGIRPLTSVTRAPTMRPDGSILFESGYDRQTGLLHWPNADFPPIPNEPSRDDARAAYECLCETVRHFPFAANHHRAAWVTSVLTLLARGAIGDDSVPLFAMTANTQGSGKSRLVDAAFRIATGLSAPRTSLPDQEEEFRKRITALVVEGDPACLIDNVRRKLESTALEAALSGAIWQDRMLGVTGNVRAPMLIVWFASGNNLEFSSDMSRRTLEIRLESPLENPELRDLPDLNAWIAEKRHHLVTWALTILRAWHCAGRPALVRSWGSFEAWSALFPNAVAWASDVDPLLARRSIDADADDERVRLGAILACVEAMGVSDITVRQLLSALYGSSPERGETPDHHPSYGGARDALEAVTHARDGRTPDLTRVGQYLARNQRRVVGGRRLVRGSIVNGRQTWRVEKCE